MQFTEEDIHLKLQLGLPIEIGNVEFTPLTIREIVKMGKSNYDQHLFSLLFNKESVEGVDAEQYTTFQLLTFYLVHVDSFRELFFCALKLFLNVDITLTQSGQIILLKGENVIIFDEELFDEIQKIAKLANLIKEEEKEEYEAGNEQARKFIEKMKKKKEKLAQVKTTQKINLTSLISGLAWQSSYENVLNLTIYQLYDGFNRIEKINDYEYTLLGIYTGNIDTKKSKIKLPDINWANVIKG